VSLYNEVHSQDYQTALWTKLYNRQNNCSCSEKSLFAFNQLHSRIPPWKC